MTRPSQSSPNSRPSGTLGWRRSPLLGRILKLAPAALLPLLLLLDLAPKPAFSSPASSRIGAPGMLQPHTGSLLVDYYEAFLRDQDPEAFRRNVSARYNEGTLARLLQAGEPQARRASVLALGLFGGFGSNAAVARGLRDPDPTVRALADNALWTIWFRADTPENNETLERIQALVTRGRFNDAVEQADRLIVRSPGFAEAYNQRAIARFLQGRFAESVEDCKLVLERNPYHTGALAGMGQGLLRLGRRDEAIKTFRRALRIQPYNNSLRETIAELEAGDR
jgi:tetratricopeptide (TPR) repeat protein